MSDTTPPDLPDDSPKPPASPPPTPPDPEKEWEWVQETIGEIRSEAAKVIVGQDDVVEQMLVALICRGHCLLVGVPGLAKTLLVSTFGEILGLKFNRIQFTPDLMPTDILGSEILQTEESGNRAFEFTEGPIFANLILADEINRTPPKTQAALLEAMQEKQVTVAGHTRKLDEPFLVFATQNPIEHEGDLPVARSPARPVLFRNRHRLPEHRGRGRNPLPDHRPQPAGGRRRHRCRRGCNASRRPPSISPSPTMSLRTFSGLSTGPGPTETSPTITSKITSAGEPGRGPPNASPAPPVPSPWSGDAMPASLEEVHDAARPVLRHRVVPNYNATGEGVSIEDIIGKLIS